MAARATIKKENPTWTNAWRPHTIPLVDEHTQNPIYTMKILLTIKTTLKHHFERVTLNTCPQNMIIILGLNNVLFYSLECSPAVWQHRPSLWNGLILSASGKRGKRTLCFAIYLAFISTMHKIRFDCSDVHAGTGTISIGWNVWIVFSLFCPIWPAQKYQKAGGRPEWMGWVIMPVQKILMHGASFRMNSNEITIN